MDNMDIAASLEIYISKIVPSNFFADIFFVLKVRSERGYIVFIFITVKPDQ